jgi:predicted DNA-binding protein (UPF0251 family)
MAEIEVPPEVAEALRENVASYPGASIDEVQLPMKEPHYLARIAELLLSDPRGYARRFESEKAARLYIDVWHVTRGFSPSGVGERGIPPTVAQENDHTIAAYILATSGMDTAHTAEQMDVKRETIHQYTSRVRSRAEEAREELNPNWS